jgi:peptidoglycan/xylan/chitin deacetylase (PgdA/CDA1 family)
MHGRIASPRQANPPISVARNFFRGVPMAVARANRMRRLCGLALVVLASGCVSQPPVDLHTEQALGSPLPYEAREPGLMSAPKLAAVPPQVIQHGPRRKKRVALTFDACSTQGSSRFDEHVIRTLIDMQVPATLFLGGNWMEEHPDETMELARHPQFELANHTYLHPHMTRVDDNRVREEITRTQDILYTLTGHTARLFRAPYGELDGRVAKLVGAQGLISVQFDLASGDPDPHISTKRLVEYVSDQARNGSIIVMHMNGRGWKTAEALPRIIIRLKKKGFKLMTVSDMLALPRDTVEPRTLSHSSP